MFLCAEYGIGGEVSPQGDVYSYDILLLEMFIGKKHTNSMFTESVSLCNYVRKSLSTEKVIEIVDPKIIMESEDGSIRTQSNSKSDHVSKTGVCLTSILQVGILCYSERPRERMDIRDVLTELTVIRKLFVRVTKEREKMTIHS